MSIISTAANYGGRVVDNQQGVKQFVVGGGASLAQWVYKRLTNGLIVQTPADTKSPVLINNDLIVTGSLYNTSDKRLKDNITDIDSDCVNSLFTLNPIHFSYKNDIKKKTHYGILAQDVETIFPELVENNNINGYKTVNYQELIPIIIAKIKIIQSEINELKNN
jgi:hypothetical protein